jgi:hypothetical protein
MTTPEILSLSISIVALVSSSILAVWAFRMRTRYRANGKRLNALASRIKDGERGLLVVTKSLEAAASDVQRNMTDLITRMRTVERSQGEWIRRIEVLESARSKIQRVRTVESDRTGLMRDIDALAAGRARPAVERGRMAATTGDAGAARVKPEMRMHSTLESLHRTFDSDDDSAPD